MNQCPFSFGVYREESNTFVCHPSGELTADLMCDIAVCEGCSLHSGRAHANRFHDLSNIKSAKLSFSDIRQICMTEPGARDASHPIKACYLVTTPLLYGTIRMYQTLIEDRGVEVHVSYDIDELAKILEVDKSVLVQNIAPRKCA